MKDAIKESSLSEMEIIHKIINGESNMYHLLISKYNSFLYKIARRYGFNHHNAEDILQDTYLTVYCKLNQFKFKSAFKTWLSKIIIHKCLYQLKYGYGRNERCYFLKDEAAVNYNKRDSEFENGEVIFLKKELHNSLQKTIKKLPLIYNRIFILRAEGYSVAEIAKLMNISEINVRVRLSRAKKILQKELGFISPPAIDNNR